MRRSIYRAGLVILGSICLVLTPLAVVGAVPRWATITALAAVAGWILFDVASRKNDTAATHEAERKPLD